MPGPEGIDYTESIKSNPNNKARIPQGSQAAYDKFFAEADRSQREGVANYEQAMRDIAEQDRISEEAKRDLERDLPSKIFGMSERFLSSPQGRTMMEGMSRVLQPVGRVVEAHKNIPEQAARITSETDGESLGNAAASLVLRGMGKAAETQESIQNYVKGNEETPSSSPDQATPSTSGGRRSEPILSNANTGFDFEGLDINIEDPNSRKPYPRKREGMASEPPRQGNKEAPQIDEEAMLTDFKVATGTRFNPNSSADKKYMEVLRIFRANNPDLSPSKLAMEVYKEQGKRRPEIFAQQYLSERTQEGSLKRSSDAGVSGDLAGDFKVITGTRFNPKSSADAAYMAKIKRFRSQYPDVSTNQLARLIYRSE